MRTYEAMTIHRPDLAETDVEEHLAQVRTLLEGKGATVSGTDHWGKRRFAYEIEHLNEGHYTVLTFEADPAAVDELDRVLSLADPVLRHKIVRPGA
jgi:small subunit ribosomal protein S6